MADAEEEAKPEETPASAQGSGEAADVKADGDEKIELGPDGKPIKKKLTPEEQLAAYEESLKNDDWGHQPC